MQSEAGNSETLRQTVRAFKGRRILLVGDMVADHYILGNTSRISREAPVLILKYVEELIVPGQAANTAANIAALGGSVTPIGLIGRDTRGQLLKKAMQSLRVSTTSLIEASGLSTLTKTRILAGGHHTCRQQVIRIDDDDRMQPNRALEKQVLAAFRKAARSADAIVISDYGYGLITDEVWNAAVEAKTRYRIPLILDSRYALTQRRGATIITPNEGEAIACCGISPDQDYDIEHVGRQLSKLTAADNVLITRGNEGMVLFPGKQKPVHIPIFGSDECTDVTGAGDTVVATIALSLSTGVTPLDSARLANIAGGLVVMKMGTATVTQKEILDALVQAG